MNKEERNEAIKQMQLDIQDIKRDIGWVLSYITRQYQPVYPTPPDIDPYVGVTKCTKCGMEFRGATGYVCSDMKCPTFARAQFGQFSSISTTGGNWQILNEGSKE